MAIGTRSAASKPQDSENTRRAWIADLYSLHGPPGPSPVPEFPSCPVAPFVEPRTAEFHVRISERDLEILLRGCDPNVPACPWQDMYEGEDDGEVPERKWIVFAEEGDGVVRVHMHRSWTGIKLIELTIDISPSRPLLDNAAPLEDDEATATHARGERTEMDWAPRITHITFETHEDYKLKGASEEVYKHVALEVCWWVLDVCLVSEAEKEAV